MRFKAVIQIRGVVGDLVGKINELCFQGRPLLQQVVGQLWEFFGGVVTRVLDDALAHLKGQVQAAKGRVALLEILYDAQGVQIVVEPQAMLAHGRVESFLPRVSKGRVADVMHQGEGFDQIDIQVKGGGYGAGNLGDLNRMRQPIAEVVGIAPGENLGLGLEAAERARVNDPVAIALEVVAVRMLRLGATAPAGVLHAHRIVSEHGKSLERKFQGFKFRVTRSPRHCEMPALET